MVPSFFEFNFEHNDLILGQDQPVVIFFRDEKDANSTFMEEYRKAAENLEGLIAFAYAGLTNNIQMNLLRFMEMEKSDLPMLVALRPSEHLRYRSQVDMERLDEDYIMRWVSAVAKREEKPWVRSADEGDLTGPLVELVGTNHDTFLEDNKDKEVFIDYYAPWCSHC